MALSNAEPVPVNVVGSSTFGIYPKISVERTYNMFISDGWLINYAGFQKKTDVLPTGEGRGFFHSIRGNFIIAVVSGSVYKILTNLAPIFIGNIDTTSGEVSIDENLSNQICIVDGQAAWIYNYVNNTLTKQTLTFLGNPIIPNYVCFHNTFFLIGSSPVSENSQNWYAFERATDNTIQLNTQLQLQTKPDSALAVKRLPGRGNNVLVLGSTVCEVWSQVGGTENYRRIASFNIDNGTVSVSTIAANEDFICWLSQNENNAPTIRFTDGASSQRISSDGIDNLLEKIQFPSQSTAFFFRQSGHLFYQITFFNPADNLTLIYDFNTKQFYDITDENMNYHPARQIVYFNKKTYFISLNDASIYEMGIDFISYNYNLDDTIDGDEIPRIRICKTIRRADASRFRVGEFTFWLEQGVNDYFRSEETCNGTLITQTGNNRIVSQIGIPLLSQSGICNTIGNRPRVDMSFSKNGNQSFSNIVGKNLNINGRYRNRIRWQRLGQANEFTPQLRFWGLQRFVAMDGIAEII